MKEEKNKHPNKIKINLISNTKEQDTIINNKIRLDKINKICEIGEAQIPLSKNNTQVQVSGQKRKSRDNNIFKYH
ncbi:hypothetical protein P170DRAFT_352630 [Aspergillus steynii IBT 23096]|uniref:Uncharacterized protein n=1 Tax=Aspergillus steynii IBT 23096 TaxID=1392250 RepID=A0A2I2GFF2_9EURO|nr:uncharacterized protein P170DRAFT_352630 [Aspergillus steynii IBT 23096]PLB51609.1 hypothetical protein P170DRAFT_352630 [Aspergillus steynii IBT 23096]